MNKNQTPLYNLDIPKVYEQLETSLTGISSHEANSRLKKYGLNELSAKKIPLWKRLIEPFSSYFAMVIIAAALLSVVEKKWLEAIVISFIIVVNAIIFYIQQLSVNRVLKTLRSQDKQILSVIRDGAELQIASERLVPGDIIHVSEGMKVPADGRLIEVSQLQADESLLTGESLPIHKQSDAISGTKELYDQKNMLFKGSYVRTGTGLLLITTTGDRTQLGAINTLASGADRGKTPIEAKIDDLTKKILISIGTASVAVFLMAIIRGIALDEALRFTLSLIVSAVPEGLPVALTLVLLLSAHTMAKQKALVKKISAMETMGAVTLIVTDKTGTITKNKLSLVESHSSPHRTDYFTQSVRASLNITKGHSSDPLDSLLIDAVKNSKIPKSWKKIHDYPFDQSLRMSGSVWKVKNGYMLFVKGAPEGILHHSKEIGAAESTLRGYTQKGYRTIGFASKRLPSAPATLDHALFKNLTFEGFIALSDQLRPKINQAISEAHQAGIKVVMLTGDHLETATYVATQVGIISSGYEAANSSSIANKSPSEIRKSLENIKVFGRVLPEHKYALLQATKGFEITAMTGDGVNDIPALVESDAGLAMGSGADAAKDASDIVLIDSNFHTIINAVRTGRTVLANIKKMVGYLLATSGGEVLTMLTALVLNIPLPITAVMVLWVNLVTDGVSVIPLGLSPAESHQMKRPPRHPRAPLLDHVMVIRIILLAITMAATVLITFKYNLSKGLAYAQTAAFLSLIVMQWANAFNMNLEFKSWIVNITKPNFKLMGAIGLSIIINIAVFTTSMGDLLGLVSLQAHDAFLAVIIPLFGAFMVSDCYKLVLYLLSKRNEKPKSKPHN
jgi:P-type Ca2+ transporter type 2C